MFEKNSEHMNREITLRLASWKSVGLVIIELDVSVGIAGGKDGPWVRPAFESSLVEVTRRGLVGDNAGRLWTRVCDAICGGFDDEDVGSSAEGICWGIGRFCGKDNVEISWGWTEETFANMGCVLAVIAICCGYLGGDGCFFPRWSTSTDNHIGQLLLIP